MIRLNAVQRRRRSCRKSMANAIFHHEYFVSLQNYLQQLLSLVFTRFLEQGNSPKLLSHLRWMSYSTALTTLSWFIEGIAKLKFSFYDIKLIYADSYVLMMEAADLSEILISIYQAIPSHTTTNRKFSHSQPQVPQIIPSLYGALLKRETKFDPCKVTSKSHGHNFWMQVIQSM
jgi:hypothetical protein